MTQGYIQIYTGNGKGKTTCVLGLALRACGAGKRVYIGQFIKNEEYSEIVAIRKYLPNIVVEQYGNGNFVKQGNGEAEDKIIAQEGCKKALLALESKKFDIVILDEINVAIFLQLISLSDAFNIIEKKPFETELVFTGRYADAAIIEKADLVTEMTEIKHYFQKGVTARTGIEK